MGFWKRYSGPVKGATLRVISLGAGVQSSVLALMAARGEIGPMPDAAIFADTGWEPRAVYKHLDWLEGQLPFPVYRVSAGDIKQDIIDGYGHKTKRFASMPFFLSDGGMGRRQCTNEYKVQPIHQKVRELSGLKKGERAKGVAVEQWIGISTDEHSRMKQARHSWVIHRWPLLEQEMSRTDCITWFGQYYPDRQLATSSCIGCPYHDKKAWQSLTDEEMQEAIEFDEAVRHSPGLVQQQYLHQDRIPLKDVDIQSPESAGQISLLDECEGMCGL